MEEGVLIMSGSNRDKLINGVNVVTSKNNQNLIKLVDDYDVDNVSNKITNIVISYIDYINNKIWKKRKNVLVISHYLQPEDFKINELVFDLAKI